MAANMGRKHPDFYNMPPDVLRGLTVGEMGARGWLVRARCQRCATVLTVRLDHVARLIGPQTILWGAEAPCRAWIHDGHRRCNGRVRFEAAAVDGGSWVELKGGQMVEDAREFRRRAREAYLAREAEKRTAQKGG